MDDCGRVENGNVGEKLMEIERLRNDRESTCGSWNSKKVA